jgi:hypothetical protein
MSEMIEPTYLPFTADELRPHFLRDADGHVSYFLASGSQ